MNVNPIIRNEDPVMDSDVLTILRRFASGELRPHEFRDRLYSDPAFESFLGNDQNLDPSNYVRGSAYQFLLECDLDDPGDILSAHGAVCDFLDRNGYAHEKTSEYADFYDLMLKASPSWLSPDAKYVKDHIMPAGAGLSGRELQTWLTGQLLEKYRCVSNPPEWIQGPCWPHGTAGPFVFLGQLDVAGYFHDFATVYVFHDPSSGECESIVQCF